MKKIVLLMAVILPIVFISCGDDNDEPSASDNDDYVDLGLPSGTLWATRNVGANAPEDYGDYFAWGETETKEVYNMHTYKWYHDGYYDASNKWHGGGLTKYCGYGVCGVYGFCGFWDNKTELDSSDDAARAHYPGGCTPSEEQIKELCDSCTWQWTTRNGVNGHLVTGPNGNTMFLPAAGYRGGDSLYFAGKFGDYWSRTLCTYFPVRAWPLSISSDSQGYWANEDREYGFTVRAVRISQN